MIAMKTRLGSHAVSRGIISIRECRAIDGEARRVVS